MRQRLRTGVLVVLATSVFAACATDHGVETSGALQAGDVVTPDTSDPDTSDPGPDDTDPDSTVPDTSDPGPDDTGPGTSDPDGTVPDTSDPGPDDTGPGTSDPDGTDPPPSDILDFGDEKPGRDYDEFLVAALADVEAWWAEQYPLLYGEPFVPLQGKIYAGYPERDDPIPGCGSDEETTYADLALYGAFYCPTGDFMAYDDGENGILFSLADQFGPSILGVVLAHEYGHAIQERSGVLADLPPTILTEQQADCFSGAWVARAVNGESTGVTLNDNDIKTGLIAMITVRDPIGIDQFEPGGHGSAFDRVGAFQVGFSEGPARCAELIDDPLPLMPNVFVQEPSSAEGNSPFGYDEGQIANFVSNDLNVFWQRALNGVGDEPFPTLEVVPFTDPDEVRCDDLAGDPLVGTLYCASTGEVFVDDQLAQDRYRDFGDFAIGYMLGTAWSEAAQQQIDSPLGDEDRALITDCFTGAWAQTLIPDEQNQNNSATDVFVEPGDLDEAIQTALVVGDDTSTDDVLGSPFEKIDSFRRGVLGSVDACRDLLGD